MQQLRQNLGTQAAIFAARGTRAGVGSAASIVSNSVSNFNADERTRRMNLLGKEAHLRAQGVLSGLHQLTSETQMGQAFRQRTLDRIPTDPKAWGQISKGMSSQGGYGFKPFTG